MFILQDEIKDQLSSQDGMGKAIADVGYQSAQSRIESIRKDRYANSSSYTPEHLDMLYKQEKAIGDLTTSYMSMFNAGEIVDWDSFLQTEDAKIAIENFATATGQEFNDAREDIAGLISGELKQVEPEDIEINVKAKVNKENIHNQLMELGMGGSVNLTTRPVINSNDLISAGWETEANQLATVFSSTFSNIDGTIAMNFTPIMTDENGQYIGVMSPDALQEYAESVIAGTREDDLNLKIGSTFEGENAIKDAEKVAEEIHNLQEEYYEEDIELGIYAENNASNVINEVSKEEIEDKVVEINGEDNVSDIIKLWEELSLQPKFATLTAEDQATQVIDLWNAMTPEQHTAFLNGELTVTDNATATVTAVNTAIDMLPLSPEAKITAQDYATQKVNNATIALNSLDGKTVHTYIVTHQKSTSELSGSAHLQGTARTSGTISDTSWLKDKWKIPTSEYSLTGERGMEMYVDPETNTWETLGEKGAEFRHIPKGAVVFNAEQTKKLLSRGYIFSRGKALLNGTAHLGEGNGWRPNPSSAYSGSSGTGSSNNSGNSNSNNNNNNSDSKTKDKIDWIVVLLSRIQRVITNVGKVASATFKSWTERSTALESQISSVKQEMEYQKQGADRYLQEANSVGLSDEYAKKVQDGTIDIESIEDETLREQISEYQQW